jgi:hypothetical protein
MKINQRPIKVIKPKPVYWYIVAEKNGRRIISGYRTTEEEAYQFGYKLDCPFEVIPLRTKDIKRAKSILRGISLERGEGIEKSMQPIYKIKE